MFSLWFDYYPMLLPTSCEYLPVLFEGNVCMTTGGHNLGRVGIVTHRERHPGSFEIIHIKDSMGHTFATRY